MARRTLDRPPSDRYVSRPEGGEVPPGGPLGRASPALERWPPIHGWRATVLALLSASVTAAVIVVLAGVLGTTVGTLFVAGFGGALDGLLLAGSFRSRSARRGLAIGLAVAAVWAGALGTWLLALSEGGSLGLIDFMWATTGLLIPAATVVAGLAAAWGASVGLLPQ